MAPKKYEIKTPSRCGKCERAQSCGFLNQLHQKPFDAKGVLLDCKAFYITFCDLEERCRVPFGDPEEMKKYHEETDAGKRPFLNPAMVVNGAMEQSTRWAWGAFRRSDTPPSKRYLNG